jgi:hypothetical protein
MAQNGAQHARGSVGLMFCCGLLPFSEAGSLPFPLT